MATILNELAEAARLRVEDDKKRISFAEMRARAQAHAARKNKSEGTNRFLAAIRRPHLSFICELKKASPSLGIIDPVFDVSALVSAYEQAGVDAISCLTEPTRFLGSDEIFALVRNQAQVPLLRKDFTVDAYQIYQACAMGADCVLLICALHTTQSLHDLLEIAHELGLVALVEAHDEAEIMQALDAGAALVGVNNRNLHDFSVSMDNAARLREAVGSRALFVAESGVSGPDDIARIKAIEADGVLIGTYMMRSSDKTACLAELREASL